MFQILFRLMTSSSFQTLQKNYQVYGFTLPSDHIAESQDHDVGTVLIIAFQ